MNAFLPIIRLSPCILVLAALSFVSSCNEDDSKPITIKGSEFTPTSVKLTDTGTCLEIAMSDDHRDIVIFFPMPSLSLSQDGTSIVQAFETPNRQVMASVHDTDGRLYVAEAGSVKINIENHLVSGQFEFEAISGDQTLSVKNGQFPYQSVAPVEIRICRERVNVGEDPSSQTDFWYDADGFLVARRAGPGSYPDIHFCDEYHRTGSRVEHVEYTRNGFKQGIEVKYDQNLRVAMLKFSAPSTQVVEFEYDAQGLLIEADGQCIIHEGGNVVQVGCGDAGAAYKYSEFDDKINPGTLLLQALHNQPALVYYFFGENGLMLSENNPFVREFRLAGQQEFLKETIETVFYDNDLLGYYGIELQGEGKSAGHTYIYCFP